MNSAIETTLNILCNLIELSSMCNCINLVIGAMFALMKGRPKLSKLLAAMCPIGLGIGIVVPGTTAYVVNQFHNSFVGIILAIILAAIAVAVLGAYVFLPSIIAYHDKHRKWEMICCINLAAGLFPFGWLALLYYALSRKTVYCHSKVQSVSGQSQQKTYKPGKNSPRDIAATRVLAMMTRI